MAFRTLPTAAIADACVRLGVAGHALGLTPVVAGSHASGPARPVRHAGSVDVFFEALRGAQPGEVLVIDNGGRLDEGCIGDLTALEAIHHQAAAVVVDGCHRDTAALRKLGIPVWSRGHFPFGPRAARPRPPDALQGALVGGHLVHPGDGVVCDDDGAVFVPAADVERVAALAKRIQHTEAEQARRAEGDEPLCEQFQVDVYLKERARDPQLTFRGHLRAIGKAIEE